MFHRPQLLRAFRWNDAFLLHGSSPITSPIRISTVQRSSHVVSKARPFQRGITTATPTRSSHPTSAIRTWRNSALRNTRQTRKSSSHMPPNQNVDGQPKSMSERMKEMSKKYGWLVLGIYLGLSALDFPFCFLAVRMFGTERIAEAEHAIIDRVWTALEQVIPSLKGRREKNEALQAIAEETTREGGEPGEVGATHKSNEQASIWTQLILAYGIHKSLIFFRIPLTVAVTPKVVKTLRSWGWTIGGKTGPKPV